MWEKIKQFFSKIDRKVWLGLVIGTLIITAIIASWLIWDAAENRRIDAEAVTLQENLRVNYGEKAKVSDFLAELKGTLVENHEIDTNTLGTKTVQFDYINIKNKRRTREFTIEVVDPNAPTIYGSEFYTVPVGYEGRLTDLMLSFDDLDNHPTREIIGEYDLDTPGEYPLEYVITDNYQNSTRKKFTLKVIKPSPNTSQPQPAKKLPVSEVIKTHKTSHTEIGIDVSSWQGEIDWEAVRDSGVEFAFIRVGYQLDYNTEYILDKTFQANIAGATEAGLPVGVYFYTYANTTEEAQRQADWIVEQLGDYPVKLGIAFDWEDWADFNNASMSLRTVQQVAEEFLTTVRQHGYTGLLYSSKVYLDRIWQPGAWLPEEAQVWLAQYYDYATYTGKYRYWQLSNSGKVPGIEGDVDLDVRYLR